MPCNWLPKWCQKAKGNTSVPHSANVQQPADIHHSTNVVQAPTHLALTSVPDDETELIIREILRIYGCLRIRKKDLTPCKEVNNLFGRLVDLCIQPHSQAMIRNVSNSLYLRQSSLLLNPPGSRRSSRPKQGGGIEKAVCRRRISSGATLVSSHRQWRS